MNPTEKLKKVISKIQEIAETCNYSICVLERLSNDNVYCFLAIGNTAQVGPELVPKRINSHAFFASLWEKCPGDIASGTKAALKHADCPGGLLEDRDRDFLVEGKMSYIKIRAI